MNTLLPSAVQAKDQAKHLRAKMTKDGTPVGHAKSLELVAHQYGFRDWNAMFAAIGNGPPKSWAIGKKVKGTYLTQRFTAHVVAIEVLQSGWFRIELHFEKGVDVVTSDGFSNFRTRVRGVVGPKGISKEQTSDGQPHLQIDLR